MYKYKKNKIFNDYAKKVMCLSTSSHQYIIQKDTIQHKLACTIQYFVPHNTETLTY